MSEDDELEKRRKERGIPDEEFQRLHSPELRMLHLLEKITERVLTNEVEARERDEKIERHIDFITLQQVQFTTDMQQLRETQANSERRWERLNALTNVVERRISEGRNGGNPDA